jgi:hypothetical protein
MISYFLRFVFNFLLRRISFPFLFPRVLRLYFSSVFLSLFLHFFIFSPTIFLLSTFYNILTGKISALRIWKECNWQEKLCAFHLSPFIKHTSCPCCYYCWIEGIIYAASRPHYQRCEGRLLWKFIFMKLCNWVSRYWSWIESPTVTTSRTFKLRLWNCVLGIINLFQLDRQELHGTTLQSVTPVSHIFVSPSPHHP